MEGVHQADLIDCVDPVEVRNVGEDHFYGNSLVPSTYPFQVNGQFKACSFKVKEGSRNYLVKHCEVEKKEGAVYWEVQLARVTYLLPILVMELYSVTEVYLKEEIQLLGQEQLRILPKFLGSQQGLCFYIIKVHDKQWIVQRDSEAAKFKIIRRDEGGHSYNVLRYGKSSYNRGLVDGHGKSSNVRMGVVFEDPSNLDTPVERIKDNKSLDSELKNQDKSKSHIRRLRIEKGRTVEPGMSFDCFNEDWKWHTTVTINKALINQMRLDILVGNQLKDEIYKPFELLDPDQRLEGIYDVQTIEGKDKKMLERARNIFDSNYLEENWEVDPNREFVDLVILRLPTMPYGHSSRKRDGDNTREDKKGKMTYAQTEKVRSADYCDKRLQSKGRQGVFFARDQLENGRDIEGERVEVSRMKRMRMEGESASVVVDVLFKVIDKAGEELVLPIKGMRMVDGGMKVGSGMAKDTKRMGYKEGFKGLEQDKDSTRITGQKSRGYRIKGAENSVVRIKNNKREALV
ncbi:hypothetical protein BY996DRAFT_8440778 [Phakopsora pachyrhizi]|nr:hypothetical protein BY996DRAFT_8440778 [Phakopsora pachyrhizi]